LERIFDKVSHVEHRENFAIKSFSMKLGVMEDTSNRTRLSKLIRFFTSTSPDKQVTLQEYVERMKEKQDHIYYMCGNGKAEVRWDLCRNRSLKKILQVQSSPFVERLIKKGYEVLYCVEPVDEYTIQAMPEYDGKKFQNVAKEGVNIATGEKAKEHQKELEAEFKPLTDWLKETPLKDEIDKVCLFSSDFNSI
jgi:heat shock protein beta